MVTPHHEMRPLQVEEGIKSYVMLDSHSRHFVIGRYVILSVLTVVLTLSCPETANFDNPTLFMLLVLASMALFVAVNLSHPGYIMQHRIRIDHPQNKFQDESDENHAWERTGCEICGLSNRPLRSHHCKVCRQCVATFDHHCEFMGTCIGEQNHFRFLVFLSVQACAFSVACHHANTSSLGVSTFIMHGAQNIQAWKVLLIKSYLYLLTLIAWIMVTIHAYMAATNSTTFEFIKHDQVDYLQGMEIFDFPFSQGCCGNICIFVRRDSLFSRDKNWQPVDWQLPDRIVRDSEDWWQHPWQNKYWSCC